MIHPNASFSWGAVALPAVQAGAADAGSTAFSWGMLGGAERSLPQDFHFRAAAQDFHRGAKQSDAQAEAPMQGFATDQAPDAVMEMGGQQHADFSWGM